MMKAKWYQKSLWVITMLILFFPVGLFLMWKYTNWNKKVKYAVTGFFAFIVLGGALSDSTTTASKTDEPNKLDRGSNAITIEPSVSESQGNPALEEYAVDIFPIIVSMSDASNDVSKVGEYGSEFNFELARTYADSASTKFGLVKNNFAKITPPEEAQHIHSLIDEAIDKYIEAVSLYKTGINNLDADTINKGTGAYSEGTSLMNQANNELEALTGN